MKTRFLILFLLSALSASAATKYVRAGAAGTGSGDNWTDAYTALPANLSRGNTYYIADGSYSGYTFDDANSGTTITTVKKATVADHGTSTGWSDSYGDGAAAFGGMSIQTSYWVIDGATRSGWNTGYGFTVSTGSTIQFGQNFTLAVTNVTMKYVQCGGTYPALDGKRIVQVIGPHDLITFNHCNFYDAGESVIHAKGIKRLTVEYCELSRNANTHSELIVIADGREITLRYNIFDQAKGTAGIATPTLNHPGCTGYEQNDNIYIYGNIFRGPFTGGNGAVYLFDTRVTGTLYIVNNTFTGATNSFCGMSSGDSAGCCANYIAQNNIFYQANQGIMPNGTVNTFSHNGYFDSVLLTTNMLYGASALTNGTGNPLNDAANDDFGLTASAAAAMNAGATVTVSGHTFDVDMNGNTRGADGKWDRGAVEYQEAGGNPPVITSSLTKVATNGLAVSYSITTSNAAVSYGATPLPLGVTRSGAVISGTPTGVAAYTTNTVLSVTNSAGDNGAGDTLVWSVYNGLPPTLTTSPEAKTNSEATGVVLTSVADTTYGSVVYQWQSNSVNISGATSANYSKVPAVVAVDSALYRVIASNSWGSVTSSAVYVSITNATLPPVITASNISGTINVALSYQISATEGPTEFGATGLQTGLSLNAGTGLISGTPTVASTNSVTISATNSYGFDQETVTFSVASLVSSNITVGSRVMVNIDPDLRVRDMADLSGTVLGQQSYLAEGTVTAGPTTADGYTWWEIDYDTAPDGWSIEGSGSSYWLVVAAPGGDLTNPEVTITGPTSDPTWATNRVFVTIAGTSSDNIAVAQVDYNFYGVDFGTVTGTTSWTHDLELPATSGSYVFQVTAIDTSNNRATNQITLNLTMPFVVSVGTLRATNLRVGQ